MNGSAARDGDHAGVSIPFMQTWYDSLATIHDDNGAKPWA